MTELKEILEKVKMFLADEMSDDELAGFFDYDDDVLLDKLSRKSREIGKKQSKFRPNSDEHIKLTTQRELLEEAIKILREKIKSESGLMPVGSSKAEQESEPVKPANLNRTSVNAEENKRKSASLVEAQIVELDRKFRQAHPSNNQEEFQPNQSVDKEIYREVVENIERNVETAWMMNFLGYLENAKKASKSKVVRLFKAAAEGGHVNGAYNLKVICENGKLVQADQERANEYLKKARENIDVKVADGEKRWMYEKAINLDGTSKKYGYKKDDKLAYQQYKEYVKQFAPLDLSESEDYFALLRCYWLGAELGYDMEKEGIAVSWQRLLEVKNEKHYNRAKALPGRIREGQKRYEEAIEEYIKADCIVAVKQIETLFFHHYFEERLPLRQKLENVLTKMRDSEETKPEIREELYTWYGWRYKVGRGNIKEAATAYIHYGKAAALGNAKKHLAERDELVSGRDNNAKIVFFEKVMEQGYMDAALEIGKIYEEKSNFEKALVYYRQGAQMATTMENKIKCQEGYSRCDQIIDRRKAFVLDCERIYNACIGNNISTKKDAFIQLRQMAKTDNTYAKLRFAQIAEKRDAFLKEMISNYPDNSEIFTAYEQAARAGEIEAIERMVRIYENGNLGRRKDAEMAKIWREKL